MNAIITSLDAPRSRESQVSEVSVCVTFVMSVQAESVDVLMVVSGMEADEAPITTSCKIKRGNESIQ